MMHLASVVDAVFDAYAEWGIGPTVAGEWAHWRKEARGELHAALAAGDRAQLAVILGSPVGRYEWSGIVSPTTDIEADIAHWRAVTGETAPPGMTIDGGLYWDTPRHDAEAKRLLGSGVHRLVDIGGGYGGLALQMLRRSGGQVHYVDVDLPDTLYLAYAFLAQHCPVGAVAFGASTGAPIVLVPCDEIPAEVGHNLHAVTNFRGFGEMGYAAIERYFGLIETWLPPRFIHENPDVRPSADEPNAAAASFPELLVADYPPLPSYRTVARELSPWSAGLGRYMREDRRRIEGAS